MADQHAVKAYDSPTDLSDIFCLNRWQQHHAQEVSWKKLLTVVAPEEQWSYAISFPRRDLDESCTARPGPEPNLKLCRPALIRIIAEVTAGCIGIGMVRADQQTFLTETQRTPADGKVTTELFVSSVSDCHSLVVRNCRDGGGESVVAIESIEVLDGERIEKSYPVFSVRRRYKAEARPQDGGVESFQTELASTINNARLEHLASLELSLAGKSVLDVGCGVGHFTPFYIERGCQVAAVDGREENIHQLKQLYPNIDAHVADVQSDPLSRFGMFDIVHCYGLLYHLENPIGALRNIYSVCKDFVVLETQVCDSAKSLMLIVDEARSANQALDGLGCRPSPSFVVEALNRVGFDWVYGATTPPNHGDFQFDWQDDAAWQRDGSNLRCIFLASRKPFDNPHFISLLS